MDPNTATIASSIPDSELDHLRRYLAGRDVACPRCGYNLRDLVGSRCPECGDELALSVNLVEPKQAALISGLIALSAGAGLNGLLLIFGIVILWHDRRASARDAFFLCNGIGLAVVGTALILWLRRWRAIRRSPAAWRWALAAGCWLLTAADLVLFIRYVR